MTSIGILERACKFKKERLGARIGVRLPDSPNATFGITRPRARKRGLDLGGMVGIIIEYADAIHFTAQLETAVLCR